MHENLLAGSSEPAVIAFLGEIFHGVSAHFALEERFMHENRYDQFSEHKAAHEELLEEIRNIMDGYEADPDGASPPFAAARFLVHGAFQDA